MAVSIAINSLFKASGQIYKLGMRIDLGNGMIVKTRYENNVLKPLGKLDLKESEEVEIRVKESATKRLFGIVKCWEGLEKVHEDYEMRVR